jgi:hypothetical protein
MQLTVPLPLPLRFIVASEAPGVVLIYKRMNMKGKVRAIRTLCISAHWYAYKCAVLPVLVLLAAGCNNQQ